MSLKVVFETIIYKIPIIFFSLKYFKEIRDVNCLIHNWFIILKFLSNCHLKKLQTYRKNKIWLFCVFNTDASKLQTYRKHRFQLFIENVFPREMQLSLISISFTYVRVANLLKKQFSLKMSLQTYRGKYYFIKSVK